MSDIVNYDVIANGVYRASVFTGVERPENTFLQRMLFGDAPITSDENFFEFDYNKELALKIPEEAMRGADPSRVNAGVAFNAKLMQSMYFYIADAVSIEAADKRRPGEALDKPLTKQQRILGILTDKKKYHAKTFNAAKEKACIDVLLTGKYAAKNGGEQVFPIASENLAVSGANLFSNPLGVLLDAARLIKAKKGVPEIMIFAVEDWRNFVGSTTFGNLLDKKQAHLVDLENSKSYEDGSTYCGKLYFAGFSTIEIWTYDPIIDGAHVWPQGKVYIGPKTVGSMAYCGVPVKTPDPNVPNGKHGVELAATAYPRNPYSLQSDMILELACAPGVCAKKIDQWAIISGVPSSAS